MRLADGASALPAAGSVDRMIATAAVQLGRLPYPWIAQLPTCWEVTAAWEPGCQKMDTVVL